jgi:uncharacterized membrane protein
VSDDQSISRQRADEKVEQLLGNLLRYGVLFAALVGFLGGVLYLVQHGGASADHRVFRGEPPELRSVQGVVAAALQGRGDALIQLGLLCLIATPIARVLMSLFAFLRQRDWTYVVITAIVLSVLGYSLFVGNL